MTLVGITGAFSTGKTTVAEFFENLGARVFDADRAVHELYKKDEGIKKAVLKNFGKHVFLKNKIDRKRLGEAAFSSRDTLRQLCAIVHPEVIKKIKEEARTLRKGVLVIDAPLLIEANLHRAMDFVVVVTADAKKRLERSRARGFTEKEFFSREAAQKALREKEALADFVIDNNRSRARTKKEVERIWKRLKRR